MKIHPLRHGVSFYPPTRLKTVHYLWLHAMVGQTLIVGSKWKEFVV